MGVIKTEEEKERGGEKEIKEKIKR